MTDRDKLIHAVTEFDRKQSTKAGYNRYALAQYLMAIDRVFDGKRSLRSGILRAFNGGLLTACLKAVGEPPVTEEERRMHLL